MGGDPECPLPRLTIPNRTSDSVTDLQALGSTGNGYYGEQQQQLQPQTVMGYGHQASNGSHGYYAPTAGSSYGHVYYPANPGGDGGNSTTVDAQNQGINALNGLYYDAQRGVFDPKSYSQVESRLMAISAGQFPFLSNVGMTEYRTPASSTGADGPQVGVYGPTHQYHLPTMENLRTKNDLLAVDHIMEVAQATIYEHPDRLSAAGLPHLAQSDAHHVANGSTHRKSQSPPTSRLRSLHHGTESSMPLMIVTSSPSGDSPPALTPAESTKSFASAPSPVSIRPNGDMSPVATGSMYPTLPGTSSASGPSGYFPSSMTPTSALGNQFNGDEFLRMRGGKLQKARHTANDRVQQVISSRPQKSDDEMDLSDGTVTRRPSSTLSSSYEKGQTLGSWMHRHGMEVSTSLIDPALAGVTALTSEGADEGTNATDDNWVMMARTIDDLRDWILRRIQSGDFEPDEREQDGGQCESTPNLYPVLDGPPMAD